MHDYLIHSGSGIDQPKLIGGADTLDEARAIARRELDQWPDQIVTIVDRWDGAHSVNPPGRPAGTTKPADERSVRINITLTPEALAKVDAMDGPRSANIERLILAAR